MTKEERTELLNVSTSIMAAFLTKSENQAADVVKTADFSVSWAKELIAAVNRA